MLSFAFSQINSTANPFFMGSYVNFETIYLPIDYPSEFNADVSFTNGVQYFGGVYALENDAQAGIMFSNSTYNISTSFGSSDETSLNNVHLFYKTFLDENNFYELGFILNAYSELDDAFVQLYADASNILMLYPEFYGLNLGYGIRGDINETTSWLAVNALEVYVPKDNENFIERETAINIRSLLAVEMFFDEISLSLNYKINMKISEDVDEFADRFVNTFYPQIKYNFDEQFELSINYQIYTKEFFKNSEYQPPEPENRIGLGFTAFFE